MKFHLQTLKLIPLLMLSLASAHAADVTVFAASSLTEALQEAAGLYEKQTGDHVVMNFASSSTLASQIKAGATADVFFSADEAKMDALDKLNLLLKGSRTDLLANSLVIVVPADSSLTLTSAQQLADPQVKKLALGETQSVPAGIYAREYLEKLGLWTQLAPRVIPLENVRATLAAVETGNVDAGIVYKTDVRPSSKVKVALAIPAADGPAINYPIAVLQNGHQTAAAQKLLQFLEQPSTLQIFAKWGFIVKG